MSLSTLRFTTALLGSMIICTAAQAATPTAKEFVKKASIASQFEIQSSQLALDKSHNDAVEKFAQQMVDDHTEASANLSAALDNSMVKTQPQDDVDAKHGKMLAKLEAAPAMEFDHDYIMMQTKAHHEAVALFSDYAAHGKDPALKSFAKDTLPTLKSHLKHVEQLSAN